MLGDPTADDFVEKSNEDNNSAFGVVILLAIIFLPSLPVALLFYLLLRIGRHRLKVIFGIVIVFNAMLYSLWNAFNAQEKFLFLVKDLGSIGENWQNALPSLLIIYGAVGSLLGFFAAAWEVYQMKSSPHRLKVEGNWMYGFKFRRTPLEVLRRKRTIEALKKGILVEPEKVPLGLDEKHGDIVAYRHDSEAVTHCLVTGGTGAGKTLFCLLPLVKGDIENQKSVIFIDFKNDPENSAKLASWAKDNGNNFYHFVNDPEEDYDIPNSPGPSYYDPLASASITAKAGMLLGMREYDTAAEVYKNAMEQLLAVLLPAIEIVRKKRASVPASELAKPENSSKYASNLDWDHGNIFLIASALKGDGLTDLAVACEGVKVKGYENIVESITEYASLSKKSKSHEEHAVGTLAGQLRTMIASESGRWLKINQSSRNIIDLYELTKQDGNVILFSFDSESEENFARAFGSLVFSDISNVSAKRRNSGARNFLSVYADEFQVVPPSAVSGLLEKARGSNMAATLSLQSLEQIVIAGGSNGEAYLKSMLDNCNNFVVFPGAAEDSAERYSKILGKKMETSYRASNKNKSFFLSVNFSNKRESVVMTTEEEKWVFSPREFLTLTRANRTDPKSKSTAVFINKATADPRFSKHEGALARRVWMLPSGEVFNKYYVPSRKAVKPATVEEDNLELTEFNPLEEIDFSRAKKEREEQEAYESTVRQTVDAVVDDKVRISSFHADDDAFSTVEEGEEEETDWGWSMDDDEAEDLSETIREATQRTEQLSLPQPPQRAKETLPEKSSLPLPSLGLPLPAAAARASKPAGLPLPPNPSAISLPKRQNTPSSQESTKLEKTATERTSEEEKTLPKPPTGRRRESSFSQATKKS